MSDVDVQSSFQQSSQESPVIQDQEAKPMAKKVRKSREISTVGQEPPMKKSTAVRDYLVGHPDAKNADVVAALAVEGIVVTPGYVSILRSKKEGSRGKRKGGRGRSRAAGGGLKEELKREKVVLLKQIEAIDTLLG